MFSVKAVTTSRKDPCRSEGMDGKEWMKRDKMPLMMLYTTTVGKVCFHGDIMVKC